MLQNARLPWRTDAPRSEFWLEYEIYFPDGNEADLGSAAYDVESGYATALRWRSLELNLVAGARIEPPVVNPVDNFALLVGVGFNPGEILADTNGGVTKGLELPNTDLGSWQQFRWHVRLPSDVYVYDGIQEFWYNGIQKFFRTDLLMEVPNTALSAGYLMGPIVLGQFTSNTKVFIDNVKFYTTDPGW